MKLKKKVIALNEEQIGFTKMANENSDRHFFF